MAIDKTTRSKNRTKALSILWQLPLMCFILAGLTGFLYRLGLIGVYFWGFSLENIRHAHSHLMFFCWAVPLPMYFIIRKVNSEIQANEPDKLMSRMALASLFLGLASYPFFLGYGYRPVPVAGMELPLSVILSGLVMLCWYGFMIGYLRKRKRISSQSSFLFYESSLLMLFISSLGAWGVAIVQFMGFESPLFGKALTHFFLATFTEGWIVLVLLGVLFEQLKVDIDTLPVAPGVLVGLILFGAPLTFPYGISESLLTPQLLLTARAGGLLAAVGLGFLLYFLYKKTTEEVAWYWKIILLLIGLKALIQGLVSLLPSTFWMSEHGLRILYLHLLLLGGFSLGLFAGIHSYFDIRKGLTTIVMSVILVLLSLVLVKPLWPSSWFALWQFYVVAGIALLPSLAAAYYWYSIHLGNH